MGTISPTGHRRDIAAGRLVLDKTNAHLPDELWSLVEPAQWHHFGPFGSLDGEDGVEGPNGHGPPAQNGVNGPAHTRFLRQEIQHHFISSSGCLASYAG